MSDETTTTTVETAETASPEERVRELERTLSETRAALDSVERRHAIDLALLDAGTVDLETSRLLAEMAVDRMADADVESAVAELRDRKPFLFARAPRPGRDPGAAMSARGDTAGGAERDLDDAAEAASATGDRVALLRYLRARRGRG